MGHVTTLGDDALPGDIIATGECTVVPVSTPGIDDIISRLEAISESLGEQSMMLLRDAIERGETARPNDEKIVSQARRALDKAIHLLSGLSAQ